MRGRAIWESDEYEDTEELLIEDTEEEVRQIAGYSVATLLTVTPKILQALLAGKLWVTPDGDTMDNPIFVAYSPEDRPTE